MQLQVKVPKIMIGSSRLRICHEGGVVGGKGEGGKGEGGKGGRGKFTNLYKPL